MMNDCYDHKANKANIMKKLESTTVAFDLNEACMPPLNRRDILSIKIIGFL